MIGGKITGFPGSIDAPSIPTPSRISSKGSLRMNREFPVRKLPARKIAVRKIRARG